MTAMWDWEQVGMTDQCSGDPLSPLFRGERARVRGRSLLRRMWLPLTLTLSP